jgi:uncharacterized protein YkwD
MKTMILTVSSLGVLLALVAIPGTNPAFAQDTRAIPELARKAPDRSKLVKPRPIRRLGKVAGGRILSMTNEFRNQNGIPALRGSTTLDRIAARYAAIMAEKDLRGQSGHSVDGTTMEERITAGGYAYSACAENVQYNYGHPDPTKAAIEWWKNSTGHRANMLSRNYTVMGAGFAISKSGNYYFCQVFAKPR